MLSYGDYTRMSSACETFVKERTQYLFKIINGNDYRSKFINYFKFVCFTVKVIKTEIVNSAT